MATKMRIFSRLALTAAVLFVVPLSSEVASAKGGMGGGGGMRSSGIVRTSPVIMSRVRTSNVSVVRKQTVSQTKLKNFQAGDKLKNKQIVEKLKNDKLKHAKLNPHATPCISQQTAGTAPCHPGGGGGTTTGGTGGTTNPNPGGGTTTGGTGGTNNPNPGGGANNPNPGGGTTTTGGTGGTNNPKPGGGANNPNPGGGTTTGGSGGGTTTGGTGGGTTTGGTGTTTGNTGHKPPVIIVEQPVYAPAPVTAAPVAVDPPGCVYERSVRKLPGGGLQRVIVKVCPE